LLLLEADWQNGAMQVPLLAGIGIVVEFETNSRGKPINEVRVTVI
jgi:hypothetical protein